MLHRGEADRGRHDKLGEAMTLLNGAIVDDKSEPFTAKEQKIIEKMLEKNFNANVKNVIRDFEKQALRSIFLKSTRDYQ